MGKFRSTLTADRTQSSTRGSFLVSLAVHAAIVGALVWMSSSGESAPAQDPSFFGTAQPESTRGMATRRSAPPLGPSVPPERANQYLGRYRIVAPNQPDAELLVTLVNDGGLGVDHWSLMVQEGDLPSYKLVLVAPDSFVQQLDPRRRIVFVRRESTVIAIELSGRDNMRRGVKVAAAERE